ncbi:UNVERIFIED_CONTAM: hypothetical protein GTU68_014463 [Idotea baltica]|nr:hypothetical protein [Idotea baltica]
MAIIITDECINCGACEPECPNTAIYEPDEVYYITPLKCTECIGFHEEPQCAAVCPVDCCIPDPDNEEAEEILLGKKEWMHL